MSRAIGFVALLVAFGLAGVLAYAATKPDAFQIARSITINASPERIFPLINDLRAFNTWNPFLKKDPGAEVTYGGPAAGIGATHALEGEQQRRTRQHPDHQHFSAGANCDGSRHGSADGGP